MKNINNFIIEKLHLNKDININTLTKSQIVGKILGYVQRCFEDDYHLSDNYYEIKYVDDNKSYTEKEKDTWYVEVKILFIKINEKDIINSLSKRLNDIIPKENIQYQTVNHQYDIIKIFLYDPE